MSYANMYGAPIIDFAPLSKIAGSFAQGEEAGRKRRIEDARQSTLAEIAARQDGTLDYNDAARRLFQAGDIQGATTLAQIAQQDADRQWQRQYQGAQLGLRAKEINRKIADDESRPTFDVPSGYIARDPRDPRKGVEPLQGYQPPAPKTTASDVKALYSTDDELDRLSSTRQVLERAQSLLPNTFEGYTSRLSSDAVNKVLPNSFVSRDTQEQAKNTAELDQIMSLEAIKTMSENLKGASTDRELLEFQRIMSDPSQPIELKRNILGRMLSAAQRQEQTLRARQQELRQLTGRGQPQQLAQPNQQSQPQAQQPQQFRDGQRAKNPKTGEVIEFRNGQWMKVQ